MRGSENMKYSVKTCEKITVLMYHNIKDHPPKLRMWNNTKDEPPSWECETISKTNLQVENVKQYKRPTSKLRMWKIHCVNMYIKISKTIPQVENVKQFQRSTSRVSLAKVWQPCPTCSFNADHGLGNATNKLTNKQAKTATGKQIQQTNSQTNATNKFTNKCNKYNKQLRKQRAPSTQIMESAISLCP